MRNAIIVLTVLLIFVAGCDMTDESNSDEISSSSSIISNSVEAGAVESSGESFISESEINFDDAVINENHPIMVYSKWENGEEKGFDIDLIGGSENGSFTTIYDYTYNNKEALDYEPCEISDVKTELIKSNDLLTFHNRNADECKTVCESVELFFQHTTPKISAEISKEITLSDEILIGISCDWNVFPRKPVFDENKAIVDIDGNGVPDEIHWEHWLNDDIDSSETKMTVIYNGSEFVRQYTPPAAGYYALNIMDLNGDGKLEIVECTHDYGFKYVILDISKNGFSEMLSYSYGDY